MRARAPSLGGLSVLVRSNSPVRIGPDACLPTEAVLSPRFDAGDSGLTWRSAVGGHARRAARPASLQNPQAAGKVAGSSRPGRPTAGRQLERYSEVGQPRSFEAACLIAK